MIPITQLEHSPFGGSVIHRIIECHASYRMCQGLPNPTNDAAEKGTAAHELGEWCLMTGLNAYDCLGLKFNGYIVDEKMAAGVQLFISYVRDLCRKHKVDPMLEERVVMRSVGDDVFGSADCIVIVGEHLFVIDYKNGYELVEAINNKQTAFYGVACLDTFNLWTTIKHVTLVIVQPNSEHKDGDIRSDNYTIQQMYDWQQLFKVTINSARKPDAKFKAGNHCKYCLAAGFCRTRMNYILEKVTTEKPVDEFNADEISIVYDEIASIRRTLEKIEDRALQLARSGKNIEGYKLVKAIQRAKCKDEDAFVKAAIKRGYKKGDLFKEPKMRSMTDCKKLMKKDIALVNQFFVKPPQTTTLAPMSSPRAAVINSSAKGAFKPVQPSAVGVFKGIENV